MPLTASSRSTPPASTWSLSALATAVVIVFGRVLSNKLAFDDAEILANPVLQSARTLPRALLSPWWYRQGYLYRPLSLFTLGADQLIGGHAAWLPHAINVALHAALVVMVVRLCGRFLPGMASLAAGALFALLPVHTEVVASVVGRAELLCSIALVGLMLIVTGERPPSTRTRLAVLALAVMALASKEGGVAAPVLALAAAWATPRQREHAVRWAGTALAGTVMMLCARAAALGSIGGDVAHPAFRYATAAERIALALAMLPRSAAMLLLPLPPALDYAPPLRTAEHPDILFIAFGAGLVALALLSFVRHWRSPSAATLGMVIAVTLLAPTSNLFFGSGVVLSGRTLYGPSIGSAMLSGAAIAALRHSRAGRLVPFLFGALLLVSTAVTWREIPVWRDSASVLAAVGARQPDDFRVHSFPAYSLRDAGRWSESLAHFRIAIARFSADPEMDTDAATVALRVGDSSSAEAWLRSAIAVKPRAGRARTRLATLLRAQGDREGQRALLRDGLRLEPGQPVWTEMLRAGAGAQARPHRASADPPHHAPQ